MGWDGSQLIHPHDVRPQGLPASSGAFGLYSTVQDKCVQSNPNLMRAADLPSWMRRVCPSPLHLADHFALGVEQLAACTSLSPSILSWQPHLRSLSTPGPGPQTKNAQTPHLLSQRAKYEEGACDDECCRRQNVNPSFAGG